MTAEQFLTDNKRQQKRPSIGYDLFMVVLAFISVGILIAEITHPSTNGTTLVLGLLDVAIAVVFLVDVIMVWRRTPDKRIFWRDQWYIVLSAIPFEATIFQALRGLSILRLLRIIKVVRFFHASGRVRRVAQSYLEEAVMRLVTLALFGATTIFAGAAAFYHFEFGHNPAVVTFFDSIYWSFGTVTTAGSNINPVTTEGRLVAMALILVGAGVIGMTIATIANYFVKEHHATVSTSSEAN